MSCILEEEQYGLIYKVSLLALVTGIYAIYKGHYIMALSPVGVFLTSINYWRKPDYSWRRYVDMTYVKLALIYQLYQGSRSEYMMEYYGVMMVATMMYPISIYYYKKNNYWNSTYAHCLLHVISNIGNIVLYSGRIE